MSRLAYKRYTNTQNKVWKQLPIHKWFFLQNHNIQSRYMKIAICISGQPRCYKEGYPYLQELIHKYPNCVFDIFIHCWFSESDVGTRYTHSHYRPINENELVIPPNLDKELTELYRPTMVEFEPVRNFDITAICDSLMDETTTPRQRTNYNNLFSNLYSKHCANQLLQTYMETHDQTYDLVIGTRFDYLNHFIINLHDVDASKLNIIHSAHFNINDSYVITNPALYNDYTQAYRNLEQYINDNRIQQLCMKYCNKFEIVPEDVLISNLFYIHGESIISRIEMRKDMLQFFQ
jgi:hypothetical protein